MNRLQQPLHHTHSAVKSEPLTSVSADVRDSISLRPLGPIPVSKGGTGFQAVVFAMGHTLGKGVRHGH